MEASPGEVEAAVTFFDAPLPRPSTVSKTRQYLSIGRGKFLEELGPDSP